MKTITVIFFLFPLFCFSQKQEIYIKLTDASGKQINGTSVKRGFEKWIYATNISTAGKNNSELTFTMPVSGASATLKAFINSKDFLLKGQVSVVRTGENLITIYTISMEEIKVVSCSETTADNSTVTLQATRIGWTYYTQDKAGRISVSNKYGYDNSAGGNWNKF